MIKALSKHSHLFSKATSPIVGIDLGTTNSCVAIVEAGKPKVISAIDGSRTTPSVIAFNEKGKMIVGNQAKRQMITNPHSTFFATKRIIGRRYDDPMVTKSKQMVPYNIVEKDDQVWVQDAKSKLYSPSQIGAFILQTMKKTAESYIGKEVTNAVVTVPAYFNDSQRQATKDAGKIAGLKVSRIINEPTAAALAYGVEKKRGQTVAVFDLGGGTFDISILEISDDGIFEVKATNGDTFLGGEDFDDVIIQHIIKTFKSNEHIDLSKDLIAMQRIREAAEKAKVELSTMLETEIHLPYICSTSSGSKHLKMSLKRTEYETMTRHLLQRTITPCANCLKDAQLTPDQINEVIMVGGMTRTPSVLNIVRNFFRKEPFTGVNPDEVVAIGAAIQGSVLQGNLNQLILLDVTPLSLGIETMGGIFAPLIPRNTVVPTKTTETFSTGVDGQTKVGIRVYQGERELVSGNKLIGDFTLSGIPPLPRGIPKINVSFEVDANSILHVSAKHEQSGKEEKIEIKQNNGLSTEQISKMIEDAKIHEKEDTQNRLLIEKKMDLENFIINANRNMTEYEKLLPNDLVTKIKGKIDELEEAITKNDDDLMNKKLNETKKLTDEMLKIIHNANDQ
ncbi:Heat shock 70 kDa protein, mitochondrial [Histomonas meleagridis]|uniref:Heat shock 70 kDa protein, mitochondrial n=1 Tax=Histomonas meleagridis TaxID=135588 RepID=UPI00355986F0|nr:Heat shock 70 kDa protein, mitochondrial [Histomonas meleagridis]KAH0801863.1 Heat shock 70 kDa protein, mitochondrial [Histomonas meleagridis]